MSIARTVWLTVWVELLRGAVMGDGAQAASQRVRDWMQEQRRQAELCWDAANSRSYSPGFRASCEERYNRIHRLLRRLRSRYTSESR